MRGLSYGLVGRPKKVPAPYRQVARLLQGTTIDVPTHKWHLVLCQPMAMARLMFFSLCPSRKARSSKSLYEYSALERLILRPVLPWSSWTASSLS